LFVTVTSVSDGRDVGEVDLPVVVVATSLGDKEIATGEVVDGEAAIPLFITERSMQITVENAVPLPPDSPYSSAGTYQEYRIEAEASDSTTRVSTRDGELGTDIEIAAVVTGPAGVPGRGQVRFTGRAPGSGEVF